MPEIKAIRRPFLQRSYASSPDILRSSAFPNSMDGSLGNSFVAVAPVIS